MFPRLAVVLLLTGFGSQAPCQAAPAVTPGRKVPGNIAREALSGGLPFPRTAPPHNRRPS